MSNAVITVNTPPRGGGTQATTNFYARSLRATFAWGSSPGSAVVEYVGDAPVTVGALVTVVIGANRLVGICKSDVGTSSASGGAVRTLEFVDLREFLSWDYVYCAFNKSDVTVVNGVRTKRYWHIFPADFPTMTRTYTAGPLLAWEILLLVMQAPTVGSPWSWDLTSWGQFGGLMSGPIYNIDALSGKRLDALLNEISEKCALVFTLDSTNPSVPYHLVWTRKGYGTWLGFPTNSDDRRLGEALSGFASNVRVLGSRNRYQILNLTMVQDWASGWEQFLVPDELVWDIYSYERNASSVAYNAYAGDTDRWVGYNDAKVRAMEITVRDYVALREARSAGTGSPFIDYRKFSGRQRMDMPAWLYIETILRRAFRPQITSFLNADGNAVPLHGCRLSDQQVCRVYVNYTNGVMTHNTAEAVSGNGVFVVKGYQTGEDLFRMAQPDRVSANFFDAASRGWGTVPFQIDDGGDGGRFIIAESPVFVSSNLLVAVDGKTVLNAAFTLQTPSAVAALTYDAEPYTYWKGTYPDVSRDHLENVEELNAERSGMPGAWTEVLYNDGESSNQKADAIASRLLLRQYTYYSGGYSLKWDPSTTPVASFGAGLHSLVDRVEISKSAQGLMAQVDLTTERQRDGFEPERELDRRTIQNSLFPGQAELRQQMDDVRRLGAGLRQLHRTGVMQSFQRYLRGESPNATDMVWIVGGTGTLAAGTPVTTDNATKRAKPTTSIATTDAFLGVTVRNAEDATKPFRVQTTGRALCRVQGPVAIGDMVGLVAGQSFLNKASASSVGKAMEAIASSATNLIWVSLGAGGGGGTVVYVRCCLNTDPVQECYLPVLVAGAPVRSPGTGTVILNVVETTIPTGSYTLE